MGKVCNNDQRTRASGWTSQRMRSAGSGPRSTSGPQGHEYSAGQIRRISFSGESTRESVSVDPYCLDSDEAARPSQSPANTCRGPGRGKCETPRPQAPSLRGQYGLYIPGAITGTNICLERLSLFLLHLYNLLSTLDLWLSVGGQKGADCRGGSPQILHSRLRQIYNRLKSLRGN